MRTAAVTADFTRKQREKIKPLHGVNNSPLSLYEPPQGFREAGIPFCRLHDTAGAYGGAHYVDIPNVFPDFEANPKKPESYDFALTDAYLKQIQAAGTKIFYRLGVTIETNYRIKGYHNRPPKDFKKWAEICAGIVRHYNHGWAGGFELGIEYWEIWNEPENPPMWSGTREQYFELYRIASKRLKEEFPKIKVGGYASCGFYAVNRADRKENEFYCGFITWYEKFLKFVTSKKTAAPLDFFSWHLYTADPEEIALHAEYVQGKLREYGLTEAENIFDEWNYLTPNLKRRYLDMKDNEGASFVGAAFCRMQDSPIDKAMYYDAYPQRAYCGLYHFPGTRTTQTYSVFMMWNTLYRLGSRCAAEADEAKLYVCAAADRKDRALLLCNFDPAGCRVKLDLKGSSLNDFRAKIIDRRHDGSPLKLTKEILLPPYSAVLLTTEKETADKKSKSPETRQAYAGLDENSTSKGKRK